MSLLIGRVVSGCGAIEKLAGSSASVGSKLISDSKASPAKKLKVTGVQVGQGGLILTGRDLDAVSAVNLKLGTLSNEQQIAALSASQLLATSVGGLEIAVGAL